MLSDLKHIETGHRSGRTPANWARPTEKGKHATRKDSARRIVAGPKRLNRIWFRYHALLPEQPDINCDNEFTVFRI